MLPPLELSWKALQSSMDIHQKVSDKTQLNFWGGTGLLLITQPIVIVSQMFSTCDCFSASMPVELLHEDWSFKPIINGWGMILVTVDFYSNSDSATTDQALIFSLSGSQSRQLTQMIQFQERFDSWIRIYIGRADMCAAARLCVMTTSTSICHKTDWDA